MTNFNVLSHHSTEKRLWIYPVSSRDSKREPLKCESCIIAVLGCSLRDVECVEPQFNSHVMVLYRKANLPVNGHALVLNYV